MASVAALAADQFPNYNLRVFNQIETQKAPGIIQGLFEQTRIKDFLLDFFVLL